MTEKHALNIPFQSREVWIGDVAMGGKHPVRIQSMTNTNTLNTKETLAQCIRMIKAGADYVRLTTQGIREAENLKNIKQQLWQKGYHTPLIADIHFNPKVAEVAARIVEKVRINPGNYADKRATLEKITYSEKFYAEELERVHQRLLPLLNICKENGTAIRIGVNHGSLSDRILNRFGDTPEGMVASALEFLRISQAENFHSLVVSMKSSNTRVMVYANRLLVQRMKEEGMNYPLHLGVTEAGEGEDGRIKSAVGIGTLLHEGIGDTIRVSLSEAPENEIPVARMLVDHCQPRKQGECTQAGRTFYQRRKSNSVNALGDSAPPAVIADLTREYLSGNTVLEEWGYRETSSGEWEPTPQAADYVFLNKNIPVIPQKIKQILPFREWEKIADDAVFPLFSVHTFSEAMQSHKTGNFLLMLGEADEIRELKNMQTKPVVVILRYNPAKGVKKGGWIFQMMEKENLPFPVILNFEYREEDMEMLRIKAAADLGSLFLDGYGDGICISNQGSIPQKEICSLAFGILQASRMRTTKTEYISCPSCGRTLFDLEKTIARIKAQTSHLIHLKIGIMGCIVNGPGEMADADYGYVGAGPGKVTLYKNKTVAKKNIPEENAVDELIVLIKENGDWKQKSEN